MTSPTLARSFRSDNRGFTLVELTVVAGIIVLLIALSLTAVMRAQRSAQGTRAAADLQAIAMALEAYRTDFSDYPRLAPPTAAMTTRTAPEFGSILLSRAVLGAGNANEDGLDGPGFKIRRSQGKAYGPYVQPEKFQVSKDGELQDLWGSVILYYAARPAMPTLTAPEGFISNKPQSLYIDIDSKTTQLKSDDFKVLMGDTNKNGQIDPATGEAAAYKGPFILWSAGRDKIYGLTGTLPKQSCDDVANFALRNVPE